MVNGGGCLWVMVVRGCGGGEIAGNADTEPHWRPLYPHMTLLTKTTRFLLLPHCFSGFISLHLLLNFLSCIYHAYGLLDSYTEMESRLL